jgi:hypothetical protein
MSARAAELGAPDPMPNGVVTVIAAAPAAATSTTIVSSNPSAAQMMRPLTGFHRPTAGLMGPVRARADRGIRAVVAAWPRCPGGW